MEIKKTGRLGPGKEIKMLTFAMLFFYDTEYIKNSTEPGEWLGSVSVRSKKGNDGSSICGRSFPVGKR